jgi:hypothetical protein
MTLEQAVGDDAAGVAAKFGSAADGFFDFRTYGGSLGQRFR